MTETLATLDGKANADYGIYWLRHGIGKPYVDQRLLDSPHPVGGDLLNVPQTLALIGKATMGEEWKDWERKTLHFPFPVLSPREDLLSILKQIELSTRPTPPVPMSLSRARSDGGLMRELNDQRKAAMEVWKEKSGERISEAKTKLERLMAQKDEWAEGAEAHKEGVNCLRDAFKKLIVAICDGHIKPRFYDPSTGKVGDLNVDLVRQPHRSEGLIRNGSLLDKDGKLVCFALMPERQVRERFNAAATPTVEGIEVSALSKYLQLALHVHALGFGVTFSGQKKDIQRVLVDHAPQFGLTLTQRQEDYLATFLRNEDAQAGKARRK